MKEYDVVVVGAGPGGYVCAIRCSQLGLKTAIVDKEWMGGVCLNVGCIPTKALMKNADIARLLRNGSKEFGFSFENLKLDFPTAVQRSRKVSDRLTRGVSFLMKKNNIDVYMGTAKVAAKKVSVTGKDNQVEELQAKNIVIATGSFPTPIPGVQVDGETILTYREAILQEKLPKSIIIIGGGAIGVEFATVWSSYGAKVTIVEMLPRIVPLEDEEISSELKKMFTKAGIDVLTGHKVESVQKTANGVEVKVSSEGTQKVLEADQALVAIGFRPNSLGIGLEEAGVTLTERGKYVQVDDRMATNVPGIWAIGDVTGKLLLAHVASAQALICAEAIAGKATEKLDYRMMPHATYCNPQVASFGLTEAQAKAEGYEITIGRFPFQANGKAIGLGEYAGWIKIISDAKYGEILGAHLIGPEVTELLPELTLAHNMELTTAELAQNIHAHPTLSEVIMEAAHVAEGHPIQI